MECINRTILTVSSLVASFVLVFSSLASAQEYSEKEILRRAKNLVFDDKFEEAIDAYQKLLTRYPGGKKEDEALFWMGHTLNKMPGRKQDAFETYQRLIVSYPRSRWTDDAQIYQASVAEDLYTKTNNSNYIDFLVQLLENDKENIRFEAAISLGRIGDDRAKSVLFEILESNEVELKISTINILKEFGGEEVLEALDRRLKDTDLDVRREAIAAINYIEGEEITSRTLKGRDTLEKLRRLKRKEKEWTEEELMDYGLWHIMEVEKFNEYLSLSTREEKDEFLKDYWAEHDPVPATKENEAEMEHKRRVQYAFKHYSQPDDSRQFVFLKKEKLRRGLLWSPWDSRGELYIKYGKPALIDASMWKAERWDYRKFDFIVRTGVTNIYRRGIFPGPMTEFHYRGRIGQFEKKYILDPNQVVYEEDLRK